MTQPVCLPIIVIQFAGGCWGWHNNLEIVSALKASKDNTPKYQRFCGYQASERAKWIFNVSFYNPLTPPVLFLTTVFSHYSVLPLLRDLVLRQLYSIRACNFTSLCNWQQAYISTVDVSTLAQHPIVIQHESWIRDETFIGLIGVICLLVVIQITFGNVGL